MKRVLGLILALALFAAPSAMAWEAIPGTALIEENRIIYSGSVDGKERGVFLLSSDGNPVRLYEYDASVEAASDGYVLVRDYEADPACLIVIGEDGRKIGRVADNGGGAMAEDGAFYVGNVRLRIEGGALISEPWLHVDAGAEWAITPVEVEDGFVYYQDFSKYAQAIVDSGDAACAALYRLNIKTGEKQLISAEGTTLLDADDDHLIYTRADFAIMDGDDVVLVDTKPGLYRARPDGSDETLLDEMKDTEKSFIKFSLVDDGVVYGQFTQYDEEWNLKDALIKRVKLDGTALEDIAIPSGTLALVDDGALYTTQYIDGEENGEYVQRDGIFEVNLKSGAVKQINEGARDALYFSETDPVLVKEDGTLYYLSFDSDTNAIALKAIDANGQNARVIAKGYVWDN